MCFIHFVWCSVVERRVLPLLFIVAGIVCNGVTRLTEGTKGGLSAPFIG